MKLLRSIFPIALLFALSGCTGGFQQTETAPADRFPSLQAIKETDDQHFDRDVLSAKRPVLVDFYAPWCGACKQLEPTMKELARQYKGKIDFMRINVDSSPKTAQRFKIRAIPNLIIFKDGDIVNEMLGAGSREAISSSINRTL